LALLSPKAGLHLITAKILDSRLAKRFRFGGLIRPWKLAKEENPQKPHCYEHEIRAEVEKLMLEGNLCQLPSPPRKDFPEDYVAARLNQDHHTRKQL
jgi:hypothetical protein